MLAVEGNRKELLGLIFWAMCAIVIVILLSRGEFLVGMFFN